MINPPWTSKGKTIAQLIEELRTFEDQTLEVRISVDGGDTSVPISLVAWAQGRYALLENCQDVPTVLNHRSREA
jgi:hypothetical protein